MKEPSTRKREHRKKIRNCPLRKKLRTVSKIHEYYMFLFQTEGKEEANRWLKMRKGEIPSK